MTTETLSSKFDTTVPRGFDKMHVRSAVKEFLRKCKEAKIKVRSVETDMVSLDAIEGFALEEFGERLTE